MNNFFRKYKKVNIKMNESLMWKKQKIEVFLCSFFIAFYAIYSISWYDSNIRKDNFIEIDSKKLISFFY